MDVGTRVSALEFKNREFEELISRRSRSVGIVEMSESVDTASATEENLSLVLRVKVNKDVAGDHVLAEIFRASQTRFLVHSKQSLDRAVLIRLVEQSGKRHSHTDTIVGTERSLVTF